MIIRKKAFTLAEMLIVMTIIGIIVVLGLITLNGVMNDYGASYYNAYLTLKKAAYNVLADPYCPDATSGGEICPDGTRAFPTTSQELCLRLTEFINVASDDENGIRCDAQFAAKPDGTTFLNDGNNVNSSNPNNVVGFTSSNSYRYYISNKLSYLISKKTEAVSSNFQETECHYNCLEDSKGNRNCFLVYCERNGTNESEDRLDNNGFYVTNFFVVFVDINGKKTPNRTNKTSRQTIYPDIVPFIVTTKGDVIPVGYPVFDLRYMSAKVKYPDYKMEAGNPVIRAQEEMFSKSETYENARTEAWGNESMNANIPMSVDYNKIDILRPLYTNVLDKTGAQVTPNWASSFNEAQGCEENSAACRVIVDSFKERRF